MLVTLSFGKLKSFSLKVKLKLFNLSVINLSVILLSLKNKTCHFSQFAIKLTFFHNKFFSQIQEIYLKLFLKLISGKYFLSWERENQSYKSNNIVGRLFSNLKIIRSWKYLIFSSRIKIFSSLKK